MTLELTAFLNRCLAFGGLGEPKLFGRKNKEED